MPPDWPYRLPSPGLLLSVNIHMMLHKRQQCRYSALARHSPSLNTCVDAWQYGVKFITFIGFVNDQAVLQFLQEKELIETLVALECETGLKYVDSLAA